MEHNLHCMCDTALQGNRTWLTLLFMATDPNMLLAIGPLCFHGHLLCDMEPENVSEEVWPGMSRDGHLPFYFTPNKHGKIVLLWDAAPGRR